MPKGFNLFLVLMACLSALSASAQAVEEAVIYKRLERALLVPEQVEVLKLRRDGLREWPSELASFPNLRVLDLGHNKLTELPMDLTAYVKLERLVLTGNKLDSLQGSIGDLKGLKSLLVGNNQIYYVTERIGELKKLEYLELWSNNIYYLPNSVADLMNLKEVDIRAIQMGEGYQMAIKDLLPPTAKLRISPSCNCD
ncbi:MAG: leucine-rich repeat domain-containing protein [Flavobacteriales bacterium]|nr:leucine-rich repeat domain-containing protein [Flavobacteriales bacterium]